MLSIAQSSPDNTVTNNVITEETIASQIDKESVMTIPRVLSTDSSSSKDNIPKYPPRELRSLTKKSKYDPSRSIEPSDSTATTESSLPIVINDTDMADTDMIDATNVGKMHDIFCSSCGGPGHKRRTHHLCPNNTKTLKSQLINGLISESDHNDMEQ
jgi:hypothetical protein